MVRTPSNTHIQEIQMSYRTVLLIATLATMIPLAYYAGRRSVQVPALRVTATVREEAPMPRVLIYPHVEQL